MTREQMQMHIEKQKLLLEEKIKKKKQEEERKKREAEQKRKQDREDKKRQEEIKKQEELQQQELIKEQMKMEEEAQLQEEKRLQEERKLQEDSKLQEQNRLQVIQEQEYESDRSRESTKQWLPEEFNNRESSEFLDSINWRSQNADSLQSYGLNARESEDTQHIFERQSQEEGQEPNKEDFEGDEEDEIEKSSDYVDHHGISDDNFQKISELMRRNTEKNSSQKSKPYEYQEFYRQDEEKPDVNEDLTPNSSGNQNNYKLQFEIKSHVENLKRKIKRQEDEKREKHLESKKAALEHILKKKKTERISQQRIQFINEPEDPEAQDGLNPNQSISPSQDDSLTKCYDKIEDKEYDVIREGKIGISHFQKSTKFDNFSTLHDDENDEIYEEDFENNEDDENHFHNDDDLDKNMEIIIQNNRYQQTFGVSDDNYDVSEINPLEESSSSQITQSKLNRNYTLDVEDD